MTKKIKFKIEGIHCQSCKSLIESELDVMKGIKSISVDSETHQCAIKFDPGEITLKEIRNSIENLNYEVGPLLKETKEKEPKSSQIIGKILPVVLFFGLFTFLYFLIIQFNLLENLARLNDKNLSYGLIFLIGLLASFHCMGMCGGLVIAYTSRLSKNNTDRKEILKPHLLYNLGRLISYSLTGFILGGLGSFFGVSRNFNGVVTVLAGIFMVIVGISLLTRFSLIDKIASFLPSFFSKKIIRLTQGANPKTPIFIGFITGFMPCGPLQAMQIYALTSGSFLAGGLSMAVYALGTIPLMLTFGSFISFLNRDKIVLISKISAIIIILLGLVTLNRGFMNFETPEIKKVVPIAEETKQPMEKNQNFQEVRMDLTYQGYSPNTLSIKKGIPVHFIINAKEISGCTREILIPDFNIERTLKPGENVIEFTPQKTGEIKFSCGMKMVWGKFLVTN